MKKSNINNIGVRKYTKFKQNNTTTIIVSYKSDFIRNVYLHFICLDLDLYWKFTYNVILYLSIFIFEEYLQFKGIKIPFNNIKELCFIKKKDFFYYISYIYNIINFYIKHPYFYLNLKIFINIFHNFLVILNLQLPYDFLLSETFIKYVSIGFWSFFATAFAHKQYIKYKQYKINKNNLNKFFHWNNFRDHINWTDWFRYLKYHKFGGYENYLKIKHWIRLNNSLNKKYELVYNSHLKEFIHKLNLYYDYNFNFDEDEDHGDQIIYSEIIKKKFFNDLDFNPHTNEYVLYNIFLKKELKNYSPFFDKSIPVYILNINGETNKKALNDFCNSVCYALIINKYNLNKKKSSLSNLTEEELADNYKNFYKQSLKKMKSAINLSLNNPLVVPSIPYQDLKKLINFDAFFEELYKSNDLVLYSLDKLADLIKNAIRVIVEAEDILCENADYNEDIKNNKFNKLDLKYYNNDLQLFIWLNNKAKNDKNLLIFLNDFKQYCKDKDNSNFIDVSIFDINLYDEEKEPSFLQSDDLLDLFIHKNFFYLDYFNILVNDNSYSLCYLIFLYKVRKNIIEFERYSENLCKENFNKYTNTVLNYNIHINKWIRDLKEITKLNFKYKLNSHLLYENKNNNDFLFSLRKKQINFKLLALKNIKNYKKLNFKNDFNNLTFSINKFNNHFKDYFFNLNNHNITFTEQKSFEEFYYNFNDNSMKELNNEINDLKSFVIHYLSYYKFDDNQKENSKILINFDDVGVYLYDIHGYEFTRQDTELFYLLKEYPLFDFDPNKFSIKDSKKALMGASIMFFHYVIKNFKNLKTYIACIPNEHLLFKEFEFYYKNFDTSMHGNREDFLVFLNNFIPAVKSITLQKDKNILNTLHFFMMHLKALEDALSKFPLEKIYNINKPLTESEAIELDIQLHHIMDIWRYVLNFILESRHDFINYINLLRYDKIYEFLDYPMFQKSASFLLLKKNVFYLLKQLIIEERLYDHIHNISIFFYKIYDRPNMHLRQNVLIANAILPTVYYLDCDDLQFIFSIEEADPLIFIKLYNSKQRYLNSEPWSFSVNFDTVLKCLINLNERDTLFNDQDLKQFYEKYKKRDLIIYDLTLVHFNHLLSLLKNYNAYGFNQISNIKNGLINYLESNSFEYCLEQNTYKKIKILKSESVELESKKKKKRVKDHIEDVIGPIDIDIDLLNIKKKNKKLDFFDSKINNTFFDTYKFTIFKNTLDCNIISYHDINLEMVEAWNDKIIKLFPRSIFKNYLLDACYSIKKDNFYFNNPEALIHAPLRIKKLVKFVNYINYLINFYESMIQFNKLSEGQLDYINNIILNDSFDLLKHGNIENINNKFSLNYLSLFKSLNKLNIHKSWKYSLGLAFNNKNLFAYFNGFDYLMDIKQMFPLENNLPNLTNYITLSNYNNNNKYNLNLTLTYDNTLDTLYSIFQFLNLHILKLNYMLKTLIYFKTLLNNVYLNFCTGNVNNVQILNKIKTQLINKEKNNFMYIDLINILIYVKDPIYLYNILSIDVQLYLNALLDIYNIIQQPDKVTKVYDGITKLSLLKKHTHKNIYFHPFYKGWKFNENYLENKEQDIYLNNKLSDFFSINKIDSLKGLISSLILYQNNGFFNLLNEVDDSYLLEKLNVKNMLSTVAFKDLFTVYNIRDLELFDINKLIHYFELNNNFELDIYHQNDLLNYKDLLIYLFLQKDRYRFLFPDQVLNNNSNKKKSSLNKAKEFLGFDALSYDDGYDLDNKKEKRKSCMSSFYIHDKKYKTIIKKKKREWFDENGTPIDLSGLGSVLAHDDVSSYEELNITDEEQQAINLLEPVDSESSEYELTELELKYIEEQRIEAEKRALHQSNLITNLLREYRQWYSDIEFNKVYQICKRDFETIFYQIKHPIWDDIRDEFVNEKHFYHYVITISEENKNIFFDNYWAYTIKLILKERELKKQEKMELKWFNTLNWAITNKRTTPVNIEELCNEFNLQMDYSMNWKRKWNDRNFHLFPKRSKKTNFLTEKQWEEFYGDSDGQKIEMHPRKLVKKKEKVFKLWDKNNWWKLF